MTDPNKLSQTDLLAVRALMKSRLTPAFAGDVDAGKLDGFKLYQDAVAEVIRCQKEDDGDE